MSNNFLGYQKTLDLIRDLQASIRDHVGREKDITEALALKKYQLTKAHTEEVEGHDYRARTREEEAAAARDHELATTEQSIASRAARIAGAYAATKDQLAVDLDQAEGGGAFRLQKSQFMSERERDTARDQAKATLKERQQWLHKAELNADRLTKQSRTALRGYPSLSKIVRHAGRGDAPGTDPVDTSGNADELMTGFHDELASGAAELKGLKKQPLAGLFSLLPLPVWIIVAVVTQFLLVKFVPGSHLQFLPYTGGVAILMIVLAFLGRGSASRSAEAIAPRVARLQDYRQALPERIEQEADTVLKGIDAGYKETLESSQENYENSLKEAEEMRAARPQQIEDKHARLVSRQESKATQLISQLTSTHDTHIASLAAEDAAVRSSLVSEHEARIAEEQSNYDRAIAELQASWDAEIKPNLQELAASSAASDSEFPAWDNSEAWDNWKPATTAGSGVRFGQIDVDVEQLADGLPESRGLEMPELRDGRHFSAPLHLSFPHNGSFLFETKTEKGHAHAAPALNNLVLRLLAALPPGKISFTIIDPVGLGENFSSLMHLADYEEGVINNKIWTQPQQIDQRLAELTEHMEKVIQMYLRNDYETIVEYNEQAGNIAERYHFLIIADFPNSFTEQSVKRLQSIASSGGKCGVFSLIHWDAREQDGAPRNDIKGDDLRAASICVGSNSAGQPHLPDLKGAGLTLRLDTPPDSTGVSSFLQRVGDASIDSSRVEVPFAHVTPQTDEELWSRETTKELVVPIGRTGATKFQDLAIGKGVRQHVLIAGKTGSGKSTLFHVMVTNLALWSSPDEVEFYLVDFKKGVEFKCYASRKLPHAKVIAIESDREFGLSVLQRVDEELRRRGEAFRKLGVQDVAGFKKAGGEGPIPRTLLLIDEFQELFTEEDRIAQDASVLLDRIVRQGRAFGIHVILGSQTLGGAFTLARTTLGQMAVRIALMCDESDAYLIMDENNSAPRLLTRPGEGIYNDMAGKMEGNSPFQVVWIPDEERDAALDRVVDKFKSSGLAHREPVVFEGNVPADINDNLELRQQLVSGQGDPAAPVRIWLGSPNSIKGPSHATIQRAGGNNLLIVGSREESALSILSVAMVSLATQFRSESDARIVVIESTAPGSPENDLLGRAIPALPRPIEVARAGEIDSLFADLHTEFQTRSNDGADGRPPVFILIYGLHRFKKLRYEDDFNFSLDGDDEAKPGNQLHDLICEGPGLGIHIIASIDTYSNVGRFLNRKAVAECELRVLFQMSANDSAALIESPKASNLGLNRGIFYNEQEGYMETFHPYSVPGADWFEGIGKG